MAVEAALVTGGLPTANGGTLDLTSSGFGTPDMALIVATTANITNNPQANDQTIIGLWDGTSYVHVSNASGAGVPNSSTARSASSGNFDLIATNNTYQLTHSISAITDGIRITKDSGSTGVNRYVSALLIKGLSAAAVFEKSLGTGTAEQSINDLGERPTGLFTLNVGNSGGNDVHSLLSFGVAHINDAGTIKQGALHCFSQDNLSSSNTGVYLSNTNVCGQFFNNSINWQAAITSVSASGVGITASASAGNDKLFGILFACDNHDDFHIEFIDTATATGSEAHTGYGFEPVALGLLASLASSINTGTSGRAVSVGLTDGTTDAAYFTHDEDAPAGNTNANSEYASSAVVHLTDDAGVDDAIATLTSLDSDGYTLNYSDASATAKQMLVFGWGDSAAGGAPIIETLGLSSSVSSAVSVTHGKASAIARAMADAIAQSLSTSQAASLGLSSSTSNAWSVSWSKRADLGRSNPAASASAIALLKSIAVGQASAAANAPSLFHHKRVHLTPALGAALAQPLSTSMAATLGQAVTASSTWSFSWSKRAGLGSSSGATSAFPVYTTSPTLAPIGQSLSATFAQPLAHRKVVDLGLSGGVDTAHPLHTVRTTGLAQAVDAAQALPMLSFRAFGLDLSSAQASAWALDHAKSAMLGISSDGTTTPPIRLGGTAVFMSGNPLVWASDSRNRGWASCARFRHWS